MQRRRSIPNENTKNKLSSSTFSRRRGHFTLLFCRGRQRNIQRFITHVHLAVVLGRSRCRRRRSLRKLPIEPNDNDCRPNAVAFSLNCKKQTLTVLSVIMNTFPYAVFPSEANRETKKKKTNKQTNKQKQLLCCGKFQSLLVAYRNTKT